ncbi:LysR family transcriptional regulator [Paucibacter sp. R3-3]|uniref:LysR family transcriptional regulator n=1 Tax=Roseateles agri TaxID=3098619 RepID=A0ABU5DQT2_9BURK|nr:LysR family transcriptional regulator [Paucibacter sp. R3-3]MDY0747990.1 LysR family transcriptional regulator [Paucibacter sp. R3-3]
MGWTASDFERLDPRLFRSFLAVVNAQSFSAAAELAALTQGAVSQQIAKLEERLNTQLFVRAGSRVMLTPSGQLLAQYAHAYMDHASRFLEKLNEEFESLRGEVSYAMPESCIHAPHFGWLLERRREHPDILLRIELRSSAEVARELQQGHIDFGFVNHDIDMPAIQNYPFCFEEYVLVESTREPAGPAPATLDELLGLPMIVYPGMIECLNCWIRAHYQGAEAIPAVALQIQGEFNDMRGAMAMVEGQLGVTIMPRHVVIDRIETGRLRIVGNPGQGSLVARQQISIIRLRDRRMPARVKRVIRWFLDMHTELQPVPAEFLG